MTDDRVLITGAGPALLVGAAPPADAGIAVAPRHARFRAKASTTDMRRLPPEGHAA